MNHSYKLATLLSGLTLLTTAAFAQQSPKPNPSRPATNTPSSQTATPATTPAEDMTPTYRTNTPASTSPATTTPAASTPANSSTNANTNADLNASAGFDGPGASHFKMIDADKDGRISRTEFTTAGSASLTLDANKDGMVTAEEKAAGKGEKKHWWSRKDKDVTGTDMNSAETFAQMDTDNDGFLSQSEMASAHAKMKK